MFARIIVGLWFVWAISWFVAALWSAPVEKRAGMGREWGHRAVTVVGALVLFVPAHGYEGALRLWHIGFAGAWAMVAVMVVGFAFAWWARIHLGRLWSGQITKKADHHVVDTGPYGMVRHPIYTGILLAAFATAVAKGTILGLVGAVILSVGLWMKGRIEEEWLRTELGPEVYDSYRRHVPMLVPFGPRG
jgi:protein-S-isoprenylcysteine O-methyltransferase Ste14